jgi:hypothetical protein
MSGFFGVRNWEEFQHYKDRDPSWIKLYNRLLDDYAFGLLPDSRKWHLIGIFLLASRHNNRVPRDPAWVSRKIGAQVPVDLGLLERAGFLVMLDAPPLTAGAEQNASPEKEERREETEEDSMSAEADGIDLFSEEAKEKRKANYPSSFEDFWHNYPTDPLMSKKKAYEQWKRLAVVDRVAALAACGPFREFCHLHSTYRPVHAQRFLSERRFDGFTAMPVPDPEAVAQAKDRADRLLRRGKYAPELT